MISKRIAARKDGRSSASAALRYGAGLNIDRATGLYIDKALRIRVGGFGLIQNGIYIDQPIELISDLIELAALEMQANCDMNTRVREDNKIAHFVFSFDQEVPTEAVLRDVEDSTLAALKLESNHFATFLHSDNGHFHLHIWASRIEPKKLHRGNSLWRDRILRDEVCRRAELVHGLRRDNGIYKIDEGGELVEVSIQQRRESRGKKNGISGNAKNTETITGERSFQSWCIDLRLGDRLKRATSWQEIHVIAAAHSCEIKKKGAGFVISPLSGRGGMQLSKVGLTNLASKFGLFEPPDLNLVTTVEAKFQAEPTKPSAEIFDKWDQARMAHKKLKRQAVCEFREMGARSRRELREQQQSELASIRATAIGSGRSVAIAIKKMEHAAAFTRLGIETRTQRSALYKQLAAVAPGTNFRTYLHQQAQVGDDAALALVREYGMDEGTDVFRQSEAIKLQITAAISGEATKFVIRPSIAHRIERNGTIVFDLGRGRIVTDSAISKQIQLNSAAANDADSIETALRFALARFGNPLSLSGCPEFQRLAVETAVRTRLNVKFTEPALEQYRKHFETAFHKGSHHVHHARTDSTRHIGPAIRKDSLHTLPIRVLARNTQDTEMLLQADVPDRMGKPLTAKRGHSELRRAAANERRDGELSTCIADRSSTDKNVEKEASSALDSVDRVKQVNRGDYKARRRRGAAISNKPRKGR